MKRVSFIYSILFTTSFIRAFICSILALLVSVYISPYDLFYNHYSTTLEPIWPICKELLPSISSLLLDNYLINGDLLIISGFLLLFRSKEGSLLWWNIIFGGLSVLRRSTFFLCEILLFDELFLYSENSWLSSDTSEDEDWFELRKI